jgi:acyl phosphate:glycerol-3-phosphate acyltransferase
MINALLLVCAYLLGSIPFGYLIVKWVKGVDVRTRGSGNIGMTNVWRVAGAEWGIATLALDISKGVMAVWLAHHFGSMDDLLEVACGLAALIGNIFSVFLKFKGGKGIGVSVGIFFFLLPLESSIGLGLFISGVLLTRMISVGSLLGVTAMTLMTFYNEKGITWLSGLALLASVLIWWTHRQNIRRILNGTENKIGKKK